MVLFRALSFGLGRRISFGTFIIVHVYMTTTGATPLEAMRAMVTGYEEVEVHEHEEEVKEEKKVKKGE